MSSRLVIVGRRGEGGVGFVASFSLDLSLNLFQVLGLGQSAIDNLQSEMPVDGAGMSDRRGLLSGRGRARFI